MKKIDVDSKRIIDGQLTKKLLAIPSIKNELLKFTNRFMERFYTDDYLIFGGYKINQLSELCVKGGLGIENLKAQLHKPSPSTLVWNNYVGDCDLNLLIKKDKYPTGRMTGEVMAAVSNRIKILLAKTIDDTRYSTLISDLKAGALEKPLYLCNQIEALSQVIDFVSRGSQLPVSLPSAPSPAALNQVIQLIKDVIPALVEKAGAPVQVVFDSILRSTSKDWIVFNKDGLLFVSDLNHVKSSWANVDQSFFPYAPGRMDALGYEVSELAIRQQIDRSFRDDPDIERQEETPYDIFTVCNTPFRYTNKDDSNINIPDRDVITLEPVESYNVSMYANNLIDDFVLIRAALLFHGFALKHPPSDIDDGNYGNTIDVRKGTCKCEFVDVAIPRLLSPEWFYLQGKSYYTEIQNPALKSHAINLGNWDYQLEENLNLIMELGSGMSHSVHKANSRIARIKECWPECEAVQVFPRGTITPPVVKDKLFTAPKSIVSNFTSDIGGLLGLKQLPDWLYNDVFLALYDFKSAIDECVKPDEIPLAVRDKVLTSSNELGTINLVEIQCMADVVEGPSVIELRELLEKGAIEVNWVTASYLLLKKSRIPDVIWFPRYGIIKINDAGAFMEKFPNQLLEDNNHIAILFDRSNPVPSMQFFPMDAEDVTDSFYGAQLDTQTRRLYQEIRTRGMAASGQILRIAYGRLMNVLLRAANDPFITDVLR